MSYGISSQWKTIQSLKLYSIEMFRERGNC